MLQAIPRTERDLLAADEATDRWHKYNKDLLPGLFSGKVLREYNSSGNRFVSGLRNLDNQVAEWTREQKGHVDCLQSIVERLELFTDPQATPSSSAPDSGPRGPYSTSIFVVHGHDAHARESVARLLEQLGLHAIILHEQPNQGRTIIEKFEDHADVGFAVVLLTGDDQGGPKDSASSALQARARQNVVFELGYFVGRLGRSRVAALYESGVELPSDISGVVYTPLDSAGMWRVKLCQELKAAGYTIDLNKLA
jgi:predicted nucleotide-binding protein